MSKPDSSMKPTTSTSPPSTYGPTTNLISKQYEQLTAKLGDLLVKRENIDKQMEEARTAIHSLDSLALALKQAEVAGYNQAMADYKRQAQGRKEPNTFKPLSTVSPEEIQEISKEPKPKASKPKASKPKASKPKSSKPKASKPKHVDTNILDEVDPELKPKKAPRKSK